MIKRLLNHFLVSSSDNPKSKIENLKWLGLSVVTFVLVVTGAVAQAQQPKKVPRIGLTGAVLSIVGFHPQRGIPARTARFGLC